MERLQQFYKHSCTPHTNENLVLLQTDFEKIEIDVKDSACHHLRCLQLNNLVRFLNPKVNIKKHAKPHISTDILENDMDAAFNTLSQMEIPSEKIVRDNVEEMKHLYFLPWYIEGKIKDITCGNKRKKIDYRIKGILPSYFISELDLQFDAEKEEEVVEYGDRGARAISFFKFFKDSEFEECIDSQEIDRKVNEVKYRIKPKYVESMDYYFIGNINAEVGLLERDNQPHNENPLYYHFNLWKLKSMELATIYKEFELFPFKKEVL
ncbi:hypothetical protein [Metasolibacillus sp.]|uniref:hypothetical protein n=1 Tax=Metasolibacillus sp. TaxID=2703680 RepID=UPI0025EFA5B8|nr:hypothetical protein [Metasolibacillus sp.]MCT6925298.1 hypothetical protein [Metasolibacillus sp.]MCT6941472.1 hypothetical protein [Metasolibacillus sp.]